MSEEKRRIRRCNYNGQRVEQNGEDGFLSDSRRMRRFLFLVVLTVFSPQLMLLWWWQICLWHFVLVHRQFRMVLLEYSLPKSDQKTNTKFNSIRIEKQTNQLLTDYSRQSDNANEIVHCLIWRQSRDTDFSKLPICYLIPRLALNGH